MATRLLFLRLIRRSPARKFGNLGASSEGKGSMSFGETRRVCSQEQCLPFDTRNQIRCRKIVVVRDDRFDQSSIRLYSFRIVAPCRRRNSPGYEDDCRRCESAARQVQNVPSSARSMRYGEDPLFLTQDQFAAGVQTRHDQSPWSKFAFRSSHLRRRPRPCGISISPFKGPSRSMAF